MNLQKHAARARRGKPLFMDEQSLLCFELPALATTREGTLKVYTTTHATVHTYVDELMNPTKRF